MEEVILIKDALNCGNESISFAKNEISDIFQYFSI